MSWVPVLLLGAAGFCLGGAWSFRGQGNKVAMWVLAVFAVAFVVAAFAWAWDSQ